MTNFYGPAREKSKLNQGVKKIDISIGEYFASQKPVIISTLLGSCVAVCLFDPKNKIGGMNHILLPGRADMKKYNMPARFGINAMELLINAMTALGAERFLFQAKIFGGASVIPGIMEQQAVGTKLTAFVISFLKEENIRIMNRDLGGFYARKVLLHTRTGDVYVKQTHSIKSSSLLAEEQRKFKLIQKAAEYPSQVTLF